MTKPLLIIVSGLSATGKTTLAKKIAEEFHLPVFTKDEFKELFSDTLKVADQDWSMKFGQLSRALLPYLAEKFLCVNQAVIVEGNFNKKIDEPRYQELQKKSNAKVLQFICRTPPEIIFERFKSRVAAGQRHKIHLEHYIGFARFKKEFFSGDPPALDLLGEVLEVDTADFEVIDYKKIFKVVKTALK